jgi:hypothetical protein
VLDLHEATGRDLAVRASGLTTRFGDGKTVFQDEAAKIRATRGDELILRPENASSLASLLTLGHGAGFSSRVDDGLLSPSRVVVEVGSDHAALNRLAMHADIALIHISEHARSLEEAFFELTGMHSRDEETSHFLGRVA